MTSVVAKEYNPSFSELLGDDCYSMSIRIRGRAFFLRRLVFEAGNGPLADLHGPSSILLPEVCRCKVCTSSIDDTSSIQLDDRGSIPAEIKSSIPAEINRDSAIGARKGHGGDK